MTALDDLVDDMASLLGAPCTLEDTDFRLIAFSGQHRDDPLDLVRQRSILERGSSPEIRDWFLDHGIREATSPVRVRGDAELGIVSRLCVPVRHRSRLLGYFWLLDPEERTEARSWPAAMEIATAAAALLNLVEGRQTRRDTLFREVTEGGSAIARRSAGELATAAGIGVGEEVTCVLVRRPGLVEQVASMPTRAGVLWAREDADTATAVVSRKALGTDLSATGLLSGLGLGRRLRELDRATLIGVGPLVAGLDDLFTARSGAAVALRAAEAHGPGSVRRWDDLGVLRLLGVARDDDLRQAVTTPEMATFLASGSELVRTVAEFLDAAGSASLAAARLATHRQTVYHRLRQVERLTGCDLGRGEDRLRLHLALRLAPYVGLCRPPGPATARDPAPAGG
ncbi:MAG: helix-turn-helix domain-containing protein [Nocardioides sp.]|uniref:helix-turn-helix domain-containing protein n=1 Tax=Nocardioides sp. TaxID=35761 RepID=UPI0039E70574